MKYDDADGTGLALLPHTEMLVPDPTVRVVRYKGAPTYGPRAHRASLRKGRKRLGTVIDDGFGGPVLFRPYGRNASNSRELDDFVKACRDHAGRPLSTSAVLDNLVLEHATELLNRVSAQCGRVAVRLCADHEFHRPFLALETMAIEQADRCTDADLVAFLQARHPRTVGHLWQIWTGTAWRELRFNGRN